MTSRFSGFYKKSMDERLSILDDQYHFTEEELETLRKESALSHHTLNHMVENAIGGYSLPFGVGLNFNINNKDYVVPMAIEEASVIASASHIAKIVKSAGGFMTQSSGRMMIGQIQLLDCPDMTAAQQMLKEQETAVIDIANQAHPGMKERGGGANHIEIRQIDEHTLVIHLLVDTRSAMGANTINTMVEAVAPFIENITKGRTHLRILSNYTDQCIATSRCQIPSEKLATEHYSGEQVRDGIIEAYEFAAKDIYRAVTHNKGVMNGIDAVVIASGNDWRAIEASSHAYASRFGQYTSMTAWSKASNGDLVGTLALPMAVGTVGGAIGVHPTAQLAHKLLNVDSATELAEVIVSVGLAQNLGALKALATDGIQKGHMQLHAKSVAMTAGAKGEQVDQIAKQLIEANDFRVEKAKNVLKAMR